MRINYFKLASLMMLCGGLWPAPAMAQDQHTATVNFMRQKLVYCQNIVEGMSLERYELITTNAGRLMSMNLTNAWTQLKVPIYAENTRKFQKDLVGLVDAARMRSNKAIQNAYAKVMSDCLNCHKSSRREQVVVAPKETVKY